MWQCTPQMCAVADKPVAGKELPAFQRQAFAVEQLKDGLPCAFLRWAFAVGQLKAILDWGPEQLVSVALLQAVSVHAPYQHQH